MGGALAFNDGLAAISVQRERHSQDGLERVALRPPCRRKTAKRAAPCNCLLILDGAKARFSQVAAFIAGPRVGEHLASHLRQPERVVEFATRERAGIGRRIQETEVSICDRNRV